MIASTNFFYSDEIVNTGVKGKKKQNMRFFFFPFRLK